MQALLLLGTVTESDHFARYADPLASLVAAEHAGFASCADNQHRVAGEAELERTDSGFRLLGNELYRYPKLRALNDRFNPFAPNL